MTQLNQKSLIELEVKNRKEIIQLHHEFSGDKGLILEDKVKRGEYYTFQIALKSTCRYIENIALEIKQLVSEQATINKENIICFNEQQVDYQGIMHINPISLIKDELKVLWMGLTIPQNQLAGIYEGEILLKEQEEVIGTVRLILEVEEEVLHNHGLDELEKQSRLFWMNSNKGLDHTVTKGYTPIYRVGNEVKVLGRGIELNTSGLPKQIISYYNEQLEVIPQATLLLNKPIELNVETESGQRLIFNQKFNIEKENTDQIVWSNYLEDEKLRIELKGEIQYEGWMSYRISIKAKEQINFKDTQLIMSYPKQIAKYIMGLGLEGGHLPEYYEWKWDEKKHQDAIWIGNVNGGIKCQFKDDMYTPPLVNVYFNQRGLKSPKGWNNEGKGTIKVEKNNEEVILKVSTKDYILEKDEERIFGFEYLITPLKPIDYTKHWQTRYYHPHENTKIGAEWIEVAKQEGCNYTIVHHGQNAHPFINYPFIEEKALKDLIDQAHEANIGLKVYYTIREMSNHAAEFWPWYHLGVFPKASEKEPVFWEEKKELWAQKVFGRKVIPAWEHEFNEGKYKGDICSALIVEPNSSIDNYYIEGLDWLVKEVGIDGIYIDDTSIGRTTLKRARKILDQKANSLIDMHSWNHLSKHAGYVNSALLYMDLFPYIDSLWYGEGFDYDKSPEYWLIEMAGIPYGLMGQMLQNGGNPYRGMLYGMTNRTGWGHRGAKSIYQLWDQFGIEDSKMYGYWSKDCPVRTDCEQILATAYVKENQILIVLASWEEQEQTVGIDINWEAIGLRKESIKSLLPYIEHIQEQEENIDLNKLKIQPKKGIFLIISRDEVAECR